jgi:hypothetical protein
MAPFASLSVTSTSTVILEGLGLLAYLCGFVFEDVDETNCGLEALDAGLDEGEVGIVPGAELVEPIGLCPADVAGGRTAGGVGVFVKADQGLPVLVAGALDRLADLLPGERHLRAPGAAPNL